MSPDGANCGMSETAKDLEDVSCPCGNGYVNREGTFIPGETIMDGHALHRKDYEYHVDCKICARNPNDCDWRRRHLEDSASRQAPTLPPSGFFHFFVPGKAIHTIVLQEFLIVNVGQSGDYQTEKRFRVSDYTSLLPFALAHGLEQGQNGFYVKSHFRFNSQDMRQLEKVTQLQSSTPDWRKSLKRIASPKARPFTEFTQYLEHSIDRPSATQANSSARRQVVSTGEPQATRYGTVVSPSQVPLSDKSRSRHETASEDFADEIPELTSGIRRVQVSQHARRDVSPNLDPRQRHSREDVSRGGYSREGSRHHGEGLGDDDYFRTSQSRHGSEGPRTSRHEIVSRELPAHDGSVGERQRGRHSVPQVTARDDNVRGPARGDSEEFVIRPVQAGRGSAPYSASSQGRHARQDDSASERRPSYSTTSSERRPSQSTLSFYSTQTTSRTTSRDETQEEEEEEEDDPPTRSRNIRFFVPLEGLDLVVLAFYLKIVVDSNTKMERTTRNNRPGYIVDAKRALTQDELEDIMVDTKSWQKEQRRLSANARYPDSATARQRLKKSRS